MSTSDPKTYHAPTSVMILVTLLIFFGAHILLSQLGLVPSEVSELNNKVTQAVSQLHTIRYQRSVETASESASSTPNIPQPPTKDAAEMGETPQKITIDAIEVEAQVVNPEVAEIDRLNKALKDGVVRYPGSGTVGSQKPMFLFGHSSRLPVVQNQSFRVFNGLEDLSVGDEITVKGDTKSDIYSVTSVRVVDQDEALVDFSEQRNTLILSTCTTFGARENRVVVRARKRSV